MNQILVILQRCLRISRQVFLAILLLGGNTAFTVRRAAPPPSPIQAQSSLISVDDPPSTSAVASTLPHTVLSTPSLETPAHTTVAGETELVAQRTANSATFDLGDGDYMLVQDTQPMHYQDEDGAWQRIDPAFVAAPGGWTNDANALKTGVAARNARANLALAQTGVGWEPRSLDIVNAAGQSVPWATVLSETAALTGALSAGGRIVTYPASWSDPALQERWESGYGQAEYSVRMEAPPFTSPPPGGIEGGSLALRVILHLFPGTRLQVNGALATAETLPLETSGELAFVSDSGEILYLQPPQAYEENDPTARVAGSYTLSPGKDAATLELAARIPYDWLAAAERQYPVVLDPVFHIKSTTTAKVGFYSNTAQNTFDSWLSTDPIGLGQYPDGVTRAFLHFEMPSLPPGAQVDSAYLEALPHNAFIPCAYNIAKPEVCWGAGSRAGLATTVRAVKLTGPANWWTTEQVPYPAGGDTGMAAFMYWDTNDGGYNTRWNITSWVQDWQYETNNLGVMLRLDNEFCYTDRLYEMGMGADYTIRHFPDGCGVVDIQNPTTYDPATEDFTATAGGIRLIVTYTGPTLDEGETITCTSPLCSNPATGDNYHNAAHEYRIQGLSGAPYYWQAVIARGKGENVGGCQTPDPDNILCGQDLSGSVLLDARNTQDAVQIETADTLFGSVSYALLNRRVNASAAYHAWVNPNINDSSTHGYDIRLEPELASYQIGVDSSTVIDSDFDTNDPLALRHIVLPANAHNRVDIEILDHNHRDGSGNPIAGTYDYAANFTTQLLPATEAVVGIGTRGVKNTTVTPDATPLPYGAARLQIGPFDTTTSAGYALALTYGGPALSIYTCDGFCGPTQMTSPALSPQGEWEIVPLEFTYRVRVTSCTGNKFPTRDGTCQEVRCPTSSNFPPGDPANEHRTVGGLELWSEDGWTGTTASTGVAPLVGPAEYEGDVDAPTVAVVGGTLSYDVTGPGGIAALDGDVLLITCGDPANASNPLGSTFAVYRGAMESDGVALLPDAWAWGNTDFNPWKNDQGILSNAFLVNPLQGRVEDTVNLRRQTGTALDFRLEYWANATGWPSLASVVYQTDADNPPPVAGVLDLDLGNSFTLDTSAAGPKDTPRQFKAIRALNATVTQPNDMGGASQPVRAVIVGPDQLVAGQVCTGAGVNCVDVLAPDDIYSDNGTPNRDWRMPDIHITGNAGLVMVNAPGQLQAWSVDHPALADSPQAFSQNFSFDTFGGEVSVTTGKCGDLDDATIIKGRTTMALPMIGDGSSPDSMVAAAFTLCGDPSVALREVSFEFRSPVGVPIGSTGLFANGLKGTVEIYPDETTITFGMDCYFGDPGTFQGHGDVTISTKGMFQFQGAGKILGVVDATGSLWVAWNPLDTGFQVSLHYALGDIAALDGTVRAHAWQGQGWQHKYSWLPDNDEAHFAAQIAATFTIYEGALIDIWPLVIPPVDLSRELDIAFGQFCTNSSCTTYEWGIKAALAICGYHAGIYYGFDHGVSVILGNDNHTLIDQYGDGLNLAKVQNLRKDETRVQTAPQAVNGIVSLPVTVTADTEELLVGLGWQTDDDLTLELYRPGSTVPVGQSALYNVAISDTTRTDNGVTTHSYLMGVQIKQSSLQGIWEARISNVTPEAHYKFAFLASTGVPGTPANRGRFLTPGANDAQSFGTYHVTWEVLPDAPISTTINLYYTMVYSRDIADPALTVYTRTQDVAIVKNWPYQSGAYDWSTAGLRAKCVGLDPDCPFCYSLDDRCYYQIRAVVDDGINDFPAGSVSDSGDFCEPCSELPPAYAFDAERFPGTSTFTAAGKIWRTDSTPPSTPTGLDVTGVDGGLLARWDPNPATDRDLGAYLVEWGKAYCPPLGNCTWIGDAPTHAERVAPVMTPTLRIGGVTTAGLALGQTYGVVVSAIDVNDNASDRSLMDTARPTSDAAAQVPPAPITPTMFIHTSASVRLRWTSGGAPHHYRLVYRKMMPEGALVHINDLVPLWDGSTYYSQAYITGLETGATYEAWVAAANSNDWYSAYSPPIRFVVSNGVDADSDGMPDDWETTYQISFAGNDSDRDGLSDLNEYRNSTQPWEQDSDADGFSDGEEVISGTHPLDAAYYPSGVTLPRLRLARNRVNFYFKQGENYQATQDVSYYNDGGGVLALSTTDTAQWLNISVRNDDDGDYARLFADAVLLTPGVYDTIVQVYQTSGPYFGERQCIRVRLHVLPADDNFPRQHIYLPLVMRNYTPPQWIFALVDDDGDLGQHNAIALDPSSGRPFISYYDATNGDLRLVDYVGPGGGICGPEQDWRCGDVKSTDNVGQYSSVAVLQGAVRKIGISYYNSTSDSLEYAEFIEDGAWTWTFTVVDEGNAMLSLRDGLYSSLKFDAAGNPHIAYFTWNPLSTDALKYAHYVGGSAGNCNDTAWECSTIESGEGVGRHAVLDLDNTDRPHIAYYDATNDLLRYARYIGDERGNCGPNNDWQCDTIETAEAPTGSERLIDLNALSLAEAQIAYNAVIDTVATLRYANTTPGACGPDNTWTCVTIAENVGGVALADNAVTPFIAYYNTSAHTLNIARPISLDAIGNCGPSVAGKVKSWQCSTLDDGDGGARDVGAFPSIALKDDGLAIIAYYDATNMDLWAALQQY